MVNPFQAEQLLDGSLSESSSQVLLGSLGFLDWQSALRCLQLIARRNKAIFQDFKEILPYLLVTLSGCADPNQALINFERFCDDEHIQEIFESIKVFPRTLEILITIFAGSQFLTEILLRNPSRLKLLVDRKRLARQKSAEEIQREAASIMSGLAPEVQIDALRHYQKDELLRIGASDLLSLYDLPAVTGQLSNLADGLIQTCLEYAALTSSIQLDGFVVVGMGKLGGSELNYSSDIDLLFLCADNGVDYLRLGQQLIDALASMSSEGFLYRVDMRLRPWGRDGSLISTIPSFLVYLQNNAKLWEKQALLKARPVAGDLELGTGFLSEIDQLIYGDNPETLRISVLAMKQRTEEILHSKGRDWGEVKLGEGSIRDVEFVVQYLQLAHGGSNIKLRKKSTLQALRRLQKYQLITPQEARVLTDGYIFQRTVEHFLQIMHYRQTYSLPSDPVAIDLLARRLGFPNQKTFLERYQQNSAAIRAIYTEYIGGVNPIVPAEQDQTDSELDFIRQHMAQMGLSYAKSFSQAEINHHARLASQLNESSLAHVDVVALKPQTWQVTVVAYDYLGELSLICGLMFLYGLDIQSGKIFTYEAIEKIGKGTELSNRPGISSIKASKPEIINYTKSKIVDVFIVKTSQAKPDWEGYRRDLDALLKLMDSGQRREARSDLAKRVGAVFSELDSGQKPLYPIEIKIDNNNSERYTVFHLKTTDAPGFLYEFTNALSLTHTYIARMVVQTNGRRVDDILYVTDEAGNKIIQADKLQELRTAAVLIKHFTHLLPRSPNPASALLHFREFLSQLFERPNWTEEFTSLENPQVMENLARLLGVSDFLWDDFMRMQYANLFPVVSSAGALVAAKSRMELQQELEANLGGVHAKPEAPKDDAPWRKVLNSFKDREMFRIDMRHILGLTQEFWDFSEELTDLAEIIVNSAYHLTAEDLRCVHGTPRRTDGTMCQMAVMALGKCGGRELGFASDIELIFIYDSEGKTDGNEPVESSTFYEKVVQNFLNSIHARQEGIFQVDLQLRPYGKAGSLAVSLDSFKRYYAPTGAAWAYERQSLVKMRPIAGDFTLGEVICALRDEFTFSGIPFDVTAMRALRERQVRHLVTAGKFNAKYSPGGLVDIEYLIQALQINHGAQNPGLRLTNIRKAMVKLNSFGILSDEDYTRLHKAHTFLRWLIDSMRMVRGNSKDITVPVFGSEEFSFLARRLKFGNDVQKLKEQLTQTQVDVIEINRRLLK